MLHDNAHPHSAAATVDVGGQTGRQSKFEFLPRPHTVRTLTPSDYHLFGPLQEAQRGRRFASDDEVKDAAHIWLRSQRKCSSHMGSEGS